MTLARTVSEVLGEHATMEIEGIDRLYLNLYVPILQRPEGAAHFADIRGESEVLAELEKSGQIKIVGGIYDLETGKVRLLK